MPAHRSRRDAETRLTPKISTLVLDFLSRAGYGACRDAESDVPMSTAIITFHGCPADEHYEIGAGYALFRAAARHASLITGRRVLAVRLSCGTGEDGLWVDVPGPAACCEVGSDASLRGAWTALSDAIAHRRGSFRLAG